MKVLDTTCSISSTSGYIHIEHKAAATALALDQLLSKSVYSRVVLPSALWRADIEAQEIHTEILAVCRAHNVLTSYA